MKNRNSKLFFSMTYEFLDIYMVKQVGRSPDTIESYRDALTLFRRYVLNELNLSITKFAFAQCTRDCVFGFLEYLEPKGTSLAHVTSVWPRSNPICGLPQTKM